MRRSSPAEIRADLTRAKMHGMETVVHIAGDDGHTCSRCGLGLLDEIPSNYRPDDLVAEIRSTGSQVVMVIDHEPGQPWARYPTIWDDTERWCEPPA